MGNITLIELGLRDGRVPDDVQAASVLLAEAALRCVGAGRVECCACATCAGWAEP